MGRDDDPSSSKKHRRSRRRRSTLSQRGSLRMRILACVFLPVCLLLAGIGWILYGGVSRALEQQMWEEVELIARALAKPVAYSFERERTNSLLDALQSVFDFERVYGAYLYDLDGRLIAQAGHQRVLDESIDPLAASLPREPVGSYERRSGESIFSFFVPLEGASGQSLGMLQVTRSRNEMRSALGHLQQQFILGYSLFVLAFILFLHLLGHYSIQRPIQKLHASIRRIRPGKRHERVPTDGARELSELGIALNEMLAAIESQQTQISQKIREESRLKRRLRNSEQLAAIGELAGSIGHEIGTPLATIDGHAQRAARAADSAENLATFKAIRREVAQVEAFIRELLSFGNPPDYRPASIDFEALLLDAVAQLPAAYATKVHVQVDHGAFPDGQPTVSANYARLRLVLKNILMNAFQADTEASVECRIRAENGELVCLIDDNGPGIPAEKRESIFSPFETGRPGEGTGLGLALADRIVQEYEGGLRAAEAPSGGARFVLRLPLPDNPFKQSK